MLYEVITKRGRCTAQTEARRAALRIAILPRRRSHVIRSPQIQSGARRRRYAERAFAVRNRPRTVQEAQGRRAVITSYSIHYTKLYDERRQRAQRTGGGERLIEFAAIE